MTKFKVIIFLLLFTLSTSVASAEGRYEQWVKGILKRYPVPLVKETVFDWWPLKNNMEYKYKITALRWESDDENKLAGKEFSMKFIQDKDDKNKFYFNIKGFDRFPYESLTIRGNRIFIQPKPYKTPLGAHKLSEEPFIVFPLFEDMFFADEKYEYEFLKQTILNSSEKRFYGPVNTDFWTVVKVEGNRYRVRQARTRGMYYIFEKNFGIVEWSIFIGHVIKLIEPPRG